MTAALKLLPLLASTLRRHRLRLAFTLASIVVAFMLFGLLSAVRNALGAGVEVAGRDRLITTHKVSLIQGLPSAYLREVAHVGGVRRASSLSWFGGIYKDPSVQLIVFAVDENYFDLYPGYHLTPAVVGDWNADRTGAIVGDGIAARFGWKVGDVVPLQSNIYRRRDGTSTWPVRIIAIHHTDSEDPNTIFLHYTYFNESRTFGRDSIGWVVLQLEDPSAAPKVAATVDALFANSPAETKTSTEKAIAQSFANQVGDIGKILDFVVSAVFFAMLLVTANTMAQSVRERTPEIGVLKTLGFTDRAVLVLILAESLLVTLVGAFIGIGFATLVATALGSSLKAFLPFFRIPATAYLTALGWVVTLGLLAGVVPARNAMRLQIVRALRTT